MKKKVYLVLIIFPLLLNYVYAQEPAEYNFGTLQKDRIIVIEPGKSATTKILFFNIWGNRITHITLSVAEAPEGWKVDIEPKLHNVTLNITGVIITIEENLHAIPCKLDKDWCPTNDTIPREGVEYFTASGVIGKIPAKYATITITAPADAPLWQNYPLRITAIANWYGEAGAVALSQQRDFDYILRTITREYAEEIIEEKPSPPIGYFVFGGILVGIIYLLRKRKII